MLIYCSITGHLPHTFDVFVINPIYTYSASLIYAFNLQEQLDGAGIELPSLYKLIESQVPHGCCTEAWKTRAHWVGSQVPKGVSDLIADAEKYLQMHRPVRRQVSLPFARYCF